MLKFDNETVCTSLTPCSAVTTFAVVLRLVTCAAVRLVTSKKTASVFLPPVAVARGARVAPEDRDLLMVRR